MPRNDIYDVAQIGYGPVGRTVAALLGRAGHTVAVVEPRPIASHGIGIEYLDRESLRILQSLGIAPRLSGTTSQDLQENLDAIVCTLPNVSVHRGWKAVALIQQSDHVEVRCRSIYLGVAGEQFLGDDERIIRARYLVGADGANSFIRARIGARRIDFGPTGTWMVADRWREGRIFLAGDAAHLMPSTISEGLCSGLRDAKALTWRLDLALRGIGRLRLVDSYQRERAPHIAELIQILAASAFEPSSLDRPPTPPSPALIDGFLCPHSGTSVVGTFAPQGRIAVSGTIGRFDDILGSGWVLLTAPDVDIRLDLRRTALLEHLGGKFVALTTPESNGEIVDIDDHYTRYFQDHGLAAILYRPDFHIFAATTDSACVPALVDELDTSMGAVIPPLLTR